MYYTEHYEVTTHDTDPFGVARPSALLAFMQETADHQMRDKKPSYMDLYNEGKAFLLSRIAVKVHAPLHAYDKIDVESWPVESRGATFNRCYRITKGGQLIAEGQAYWALVDINSRRLLRVTDVDLSNYEHGPLQPVDGIRFRAPDDLPQVGTHTVAYHETDVNRHMNNTRYPDLLLDHLPQHDGRTFAEFSIHYKNEAPQGESLTVCRSAGEETDNGERIYFRTLRSDGSVNIEAQVLLKTL